MTIAKNRNTFAKRQREMAKKAKAEAKRARRIKLKQSDDTSDPDSPEVANVQEQTSDDEPEALEEAN